MAITSCLEAKFSSAREVVTNRSMRLPQVSVLQGQIGALIRERDAGRAETAEGRSKWMGTGPPCVEAIPPMPTDPQELDRWLSDRNCDLRNALEFGNPGLVSQIGCLDWPGSWPSREGWSQFCGRGSVQIRNDVRFDRGAIEEALFEFRRSIDIAELIGARYGLRGVRVGEASNPGPPSVAPPISELCPDDVLASLEADLTMLDSSDDEPLVRDTTGRIVSRRVGLMESASSSVCPVVDMAAEDSDGVASLPNRFSRRVVLNPQSSGGTPRSVQDRSPEMSVRSNKFAALATDIDDAVATEPVQGPSPTWVDVSQQEYPRQRRRLQLISQSSRVSGAVAALHGDVGEDEMRVSADHDSESDTESFPAIDRRIRRRLSLQWRADPDDVADVPDSHDRRFLRVRRAMQLERRQEQFNELAADPQPFGAHLSKERLGGVGHSRSAGRIPMQGALFASSSELLEGPVSEALVTSLEAMRAAYHSGDHAQKCRSWKLFRLTSRMLLWRQKQRGPTKAELERRVDLFHRQEWTLLLDEARHSSSGLRRKISPLTIEEEGVRRARRAETLVHQGEVSRARQVLCSQAKAPGNQATLNELRDPERRPPQLSEAIPPEVSGYCPPAPIQVGLAEVRLQPP